MVNDDRRQEVLRAAGAEISEKGFAAATTLAIARRARMSKRDLYRLFPSKEALVAAIIAEVSAEMTMPSLNPPQNLDEFCAALRDFGQQLLHQLLDANRIDFYRIAIAEAVSAPALSQALHTHGEEPVRAHVTAFVTEAVMRGIVPPQRLMLAMRAFFALLLGHFQLEVLMGLTAPTPEAIAARADDAAAALRLILDAPA